MLSEIFSPIGTISTLRVALVVLTRRFLGYAYFGYIAPGDNEKALERFHHSLIENHPCSITKCQFPGFLNDIGISGAETVGNSSASNTNISGSLPGNIHCRSFQCLFHE